MPTAIQQQMIDLQAKIFELDYYVEFYRQALSVYSMNEASVAAGEYPDRKVVEMCHQFWLNLPDNPTIRTEPFFALCDIAENVFGPDSDLSDDKGV